MNDVEGLKVETSDRVAIGAVELSKSITFFSVSQKEFEIGNKPLAAYSLYYSIFHAAQFRLVIEKELDFTSEEWIAEKPEDSSLMKWSTPWSHRDVIKKLKQTKIDEGFIDLVEGSKKLREFYSYGPKLIRSTEFGYFIHLSEHKELDEKIKEMIRSMRELIGIMPQIIQESLEYDHQFQFAYYFWTTEGLFLERFEFPLCIKSECKKIVERIVGTLEKSCNFVIKRGDPLKSIP